MITAIYHFNVKMVTRSKGGCCVASAAYLAGEKIKNERDGKIHDYRNKREVVHKEILLPVNAPPEYRDRAKLWNVAERAEKRKNSQTARSINAALPRELSREDQIELVRQFCEQCFVSKGMCCDFAIHDKHDGNPHVHIMLTTRKVNKSGFTEKERSWNDKKLLMEWRERWADWCNHKLYFVSDARVDHRSYKEQGIDRLPQIHLGVEVCAVERKGFKTDKGNKNRRIRRHNLEVEIAELEQQMHDLRSEHKKETIDYIESNIGCKVADAFTIHDKRSVLEQYEKYLQSRNIPCELIFYNEDKYELFVPKSKRDMAVNLLKQFRNQSCKMDNQPNSQQVPAPQKKPKHRI
ncbi:MobA/MobL family protein [Ruminococcus sp. YE71]|uniref:MobQ family relaxase n=1 Tax=unclassified Ruminococcus TaxID=2608920 RepID=UPI0008805D09|nr:MULTISPECIES: MobQ family relaxase [unclassified Ruminococcus]SDA32680.1 MobA/MobL family protein [Ruminococcus sp. YE78]SFW53636.1 MobA/MobL family protein [Ruminococcus sp. YE71]